MIKAGGRRSARFTSPHLIDRWDCISINETPVSREAFEAAERLIIAKDRELQIRASEFELLTATAFELFNSSQPPIEYGVIEVGLGGRLDATNILNNVAISVITKMGLDHEGQLGNSIQEIAREIAGIMRPNIPCFVDGTNPPEVLETLQTHANKVGTPLQIVTSTSNSLPFSISEEKIPGYHDLEPHQKANLHLASSVLRAIFSDGLTHDQDLVLPFLNGFSKVIHPGRLQHLSLSPLFPRKDPVLLDGAHNPQSMSALAGHVNRTLRSKSQTPITWVIAASRGKNLAEMLQLCLQDGDVVVPVCFGPVDGMPWVRSMQMEEVADIADNLEGLKVRVIRGQQHDSLLDRLRLANDISGKVGDVGEEGPLVIAGSLYLVSDVLRLLRDMSQKG